MMSPLMIPLMIAEGFDGVEPYEPVKYEVVAPDGHLVGVRELARLTGYSPAHVCYMRRGLRISRPLRAKMAKLGLKFKEGK